ncbi:hypothetical protein Tco_1030362 [Tanacetum coccineum]|uniref:Reverse transcriptase domain-containing protein n=1 Tax=Tanacetum coccineum TaxID=301880 RepID=A0ABQ5G6A8_9ASTR
MLKRCEETNLVLNWEKCHFMVKEGIVLGHKVSGSGIEKIHKRFLTSRTPNDPASGKRRPIQLLGRMHPADHLFRLESPDLGKLTKAEIKDLFPEEQLMTVFDKNNEPCGSSKGHHGIATTVRKVFKAGFYWPNILRNARRWSKFAMHVKEPVTSPREMKHLKSISKSAKYLMFGE